MSRLCDRLRLLSCKIRNNALSKDKLLKLLPECAELMSEAEVLLEPRGRSSTNGHPATSHTTVYTDEESEFLKAVEQLRRRGARFPTHRELFLLMKSLGYERVEKPHTDAAA